jgi:hypothetical protein
MSILPHPRNVDISPNVGSPRGIDPLRRDFIRKNTLEELFISVLFEEVSVALNLDAMALERCPWRYVATTRLDETHSASRSAWRQFPITATREQ